MTHGFGSTSRREFLAAAGLAAIAAAPGAARAAGRREPGSAGRARNVIFLVADGMSAGTLGLADEVHRVRHGRPSAWGTLIADPSARRGLMRTAAADSLVTDSAAGGSAWGIGVKTPVGHVNLLADGSRPTPIGVHVRQQGRALGLVTTTRVTHATPASFIANVPEREGEDEIARQMLERGFEVVLGGGERHFPADRLAGAAGVRVVRTAAELRAAAGGAGEASPLLGLFGKSHLPMELDRGPEVPSLEEMTRAALGRLSRRAGGFLLQVEGGRVDHAAHSNDAGALIAEMLAFDAAVAASLEFARGRDDTLVIVTTDHANANPGLTLYGASAARGLAVAASAKRSFEWVFERLGAALALEEGGDVSKVGDLSPLRGLIEEATGVELLPEQFATLTSALRGEPRHPFRAQASKATSILGAILSDANAIGFASPNHTADPVEVTAWGPGSERVRPWLENTELHGVMVGAMALEPARAL